MIHIVTIIGARPQIIKAAALSRAIRFRFENKIRETIVHTGQHYDANMSQVFFEELGIPNPDYNLNVGSSSHGRQTALMIEGIEKILISERPDFLVVYGDTNSTLAGAIAASKMHVPVVHIEAGLRSFNKSMPEEINRIMCDHVSTFLFTPTKTGFDNLVKEGFSQYHAGEASIDNPRIMHCGDIMYDNSLYFSEVADNNTDILSRLNVSDNNYILATIHRDNNTDNPSRLSAIFNALDTLTRQHGIFVILPLHPRTSGLLKNNLNPDLYDRIITNEHIKIIKPVSFLEMTSLEKHSRMIFTDSGGVQKEAYFFKKPCVIARPETEWVEIINAGAGIITDADEGRIIKAVEHFMSQTEIAFSPVFGDGKAAEFICETIMQSKRA